MIHRSSFQKGIQNDIDRSSTPTDTYLAAFNLTLSGDEKFLALENIRGTSEVADIVSTFGANSVLGVYPNKYRIGSTEGVNCLTIFYTHSSAFKIACYDIDNNVKYDLYTEGVDSSYITGDCVVDAVVYPENGIDILYFTDNFHEIRKLRCEVPSPYVANFLAASQLSIQRRATLATITLTAMPVPGGSLLCGSYQFCLRFYNEDTKSYTKWTIPTSPMNLSQNATLGEGDYNAVTSKYITLTVTLPTSELSLYTHYQFAVIENTQPVNGINASLQKLEPLTTSTFAYDYKSNTKIGDVAISDIVVDLLAIDRVKTLQIKNNRLFAGNVVIPDLEYDRNPTITGSVQRVTVTRDDLLCSTRKGYFRDEVYRFYVSYFDDKYNFSRPKMLDMSAITSNQIANGDLRFPSNRTAGFTLMNGSSDLTHLNLNITITSHPSWARGFVILRAERKKRIKFQTPFIPSSLVEGIEVLGSYPTQPRILDSGGNVQVKDVPNASPMNPIGSLIPKNFFFPAKRDYLRTENDDPVNRIQKGEVVVKCNSNVLSDKVYFVLQPDVYNTSDPTKTYYNFASGDSYEVIDHAFLRFLGANFGSNPITANIGDYLQTCIHGTFYATNINDYYYSNAISRPTPALPKQSGKIVNFKPLTSLGEGTTIGGSPVGLFTNLDTTGVRFNTTPGNQRIGAVLLNDYKPDSAVYGNSTYGGNTLTTSSGGSVDATFYEVGDNNQSNTFTISKPGGLSFGKYYSIVDIANVVTEQSDDRYGDSETIHNIVFTGVFHVFTDAELPNVRATGNVPITKDVAGGDCYVSLHQFKITDSHYGVSNVQKTGTGSGTNDVAFLRKWSTGFINKYDIVGSGDWQSWAMLPVPYDAVSQVISVVLESEIQGEILGPRTYGSSVVTDGKRITTESVSRYNLRVPFSYLYNQNYSKESNQKAFIPFDEDENVSTIFKARGVYSDQKVYNSDIQGFDIFRVGNLFDLEETYGGITKLALQQNQLIAIQEKGVSYVPVDANVIETQDGSTLAISSGTVGTIQYMSRQYGSQHIKSVVNADDVIFFTDANNNAVIKYEGGLELIHESGMIKNFRSFFTSPIAERNLIGIYDPYRRQYLLTDRNNCWVWDNRFKCWVSNYEVGARMHTGVYTKNNMYLLGTDSSDTLGVYTLYTGTENQFFGSTVVPRVSVNINSEYDVAKTFDNVVFYSTNQLLNADIEVLQNNGTTTSVSGMDIAINLREGNYRIPTVRAAGNARLRGLAATMTVRWKPTSIVSLSQIITDLRISRRV